MNLKQYLAIIASSVSILAGVTVLSAAASAETFVISNSIGNSNKALNTNRNFRLIDGHPRMSLWTHNINDADQHFDRLQGARGGQLLRHRSTGKCLNAYRRWNGAEVNVYPCNANDPDQNFNVENLSNGDVQIRLSEIRNNVQFCIDSPTRNDGGAVTLWQCNSGGNQRFRINGETITPPPSGQILLPFKSGQTWFVCQGYQNSISHTGRSTFGLDLTISNKDFGVSGCYAHDGNTSKSAGQPVLAPASGIVRHVAQDLVCLDIGNNRALLIGHIDNRVANGVKVNAGQQLGVLSRANRSINGGYSHIHIDGRPNAYCNANSVPLTAANGFRFIGVGDLLDLPGTNDHFRRALTRP
jgi:murein DD-endopeptidase MepM/ murein hydrolase activator NlpD